MFKYDFAKEGPGVDKNAPPKKGLALFFQVFRREWWSLVRLNLIFLLFCLPLVTIGPALAAMTKITMNMVQDKYIDMWYEFKQAFRENFKQGFFAGIILAVLFVVVLLSFYFYFAWLDQGAVIYAMLLGSFAAAFALILGSIYVYPQIVTVSLSLFSILKNSFLLGISNINHSFPAILAITATGLVPFLFLPLLPLAFFASFSCMSFIGSFAALPALKKRIFKHE